MRMTKIKLINWMYFSNTTVEIEGNTLITGVNGSGKSTVLDAVQYVLVGKGAAKFNSAAGENKRDLQSYVRGFVNNVETKYLRYGDVVTHLALEFLKNDTRHIFGVCIEYTSTGLNEKHYYVEGVEIEDTLYIDIENELPFSYHQLQTAFKKKGPKKFETVPTIQKYKVIQKDVLGIDAEKYSKLLPKSIGFKSVQRVDELVSNFLLEDDHIKLDSLEGSIKQLESLSKSIKNEKDKLAELEPIRKQGFKCLDLDNELRLNEVVRIKSNILESEKLIEFKQMQVNQYEENINALFEEESSNKAEQNRKKNLVDDIKKTLYMNDDYNLLNKLRKDKNNLSKNIEVQNGYLSRLKNKIDNELDIISDLNKIDGFMDFEKFKKHFSKDYFKNDVPETLNVLNDHNRLVETYLSEIRAKKINIILEEKKVKEQLNLLNKEIDNLKKGIKTYNPSVDRLIKLLKENLEFDYQEKIEVKPVCEYVKVLDETWRNALEGYLNNQKFNLVIEAKYFTEALRLYNKNQKELKIEGVGLIDVSKFQSATDKQDGTLSSFIEVSDQNAKNYLYNILNKVNCVDNIDKLKHHKTSITKSCMRYSNNVASQLKYETYKDPFLGREANQIQLENKIKLEKSKSDQLKTIKDDLAVLDEIENKLQELNTKDLNIDSTLIQAINLVKNYQREFVDVAESISNLEESTDILEKTIQLDKAESDLEQIEKLLNEILKDKSKLEVKKESAQHSIIEEKSKKESLMAQFDRYDIMIKDQAIEKIKKLQNAKEKISILTLKEDEEYNRMLAIESSSLVQKMVTYNTKYSFGAVPSYQNTEEFNKEYLEILQNKLLSYEIEHTNLFNDFKEMYKVNYADKLKDKIKKGKDQINKLNSLLKERSFGRDTYKVKVEPAKKPVFAKLYKIITEDKFEETLFNTGEDSKFLKDVLEQILNSEDPKEKQMFLDYRCYMNFDIVIQNENGNKLYSDVKYTQSGGETQVPFYIIAAASFVQLKNRKLQESLCVALFDEAFNNMDSQRVSEMMAFYNELDVQIILALAEKYEVIMPHMDTTVVVRGNGRVTDVFDIGKVNKNVERENIN